MHAAALAQGWCWAGNSMADDKRQTFAPLPARALADETLAALDLRVLAALAVHDRFGANGIGCYASHPRLAGLVKCHLKSLSRSLRTLAEGGYIEAIPFVLNKRQRVYKVLYTAADDAVMTNPIGNESVTDNDGPIGNEPVTDGVVIGNQVVPIGNQHFQEVEQFQQHPDDNILGEALRYHAEAFKEDATNEGICNYAREAVVDDEEAERAAEADLHHRRRDEWCPDSWA